MPGILRGPVRVPGDTRLSRLVEVAEAMGAEVHVNLKARIPRTEGWLNDHVYTVTARVYCACGEVAHFTAAWESVVTKVCEWWGEHQGDGHGLTEPSLARKARRRRREQVGRELMKAAAEAAERRRLL